MTWIGGLRDDEVPEFRGVRDRAIFAQHGQSLVYIVWAQRGTTKGVGELVGIGKAGDGMIKAEGADRTLEVMLAQAGKEVERQPPLPDWVDQIVLQAGRYLLLEGRVGLVSNVLPVRVHLRVLVRLVFVHPIWHGLEDISNLGGGC